MEAERAWGTALAAREPGAREAEAAKLVKAENETVPCYYELVLASAKKKCF